MTYSEQLSPQMQQTLEKANYHTPTPIQEQTLTALLDGKDLIGIAKTGTGKTAAFAIPIIEHITEDAKQLQALVLCPTRELAMQTTSVFKMLSIHKKLRTVCIYGGQSVKTQITALHQGAQIVVGTPGRVKDMLNRKELKFSDLRTVVLDEADEMFDYGFLPDIRYILSRITAKHQTLLFSATLNDNVSGIAKRFMSPNPERIEIGEQKDPVETIRQICIKTDEHLKVAAVNYVLKEMQPRLTLVFCNTRSRVKTVTKYLQEARIKAEGLHGDLTQAQRDHIMRDFRQGKIPVLIATDVAARGIDVDHIDLVINFDVPDKPEYYIHRIGRTGRAGNCGMACTLLSPQDANRLADIEKRYNIHMER